jgi:hypothetical protein
VAHSTTFGGQLSSIACGAALTVCVSAGARAEDQPPQIISCGPDSSSAQWCENAVRYYSYRLSLLVVRLDQNPELWRDAQFRAQRLAIEKHWSAARTLLSKFRQEQNVIDHQTAQQPP